MGAIFSELQRMAQAVSMAAPSRRWKAITPGDTDLSGSGFRSIYVGGAGDIAAVAIDGDGTTEIFRDVPSGAILPIAPRKVLGAGAGTTATDLIGLA